MSKKKSRKSKLEFKKFKNFLPFLKPYLGTYVVGFIFLTLSSFASVSIPYLLGQILGMDASNVSDDFNWFDINHLYGALSLIAVLLPAQAFFSFFRVYTFSIVTQKALRDIRIKAFSALVYAPMAYFDKNKSGELSSRIATDANIIQEVLTTTLAEFSRQLIVIIVALIVVIDTSPELALTMILVIPVAALVAVVFGRFVKKLSKATQEEAAQSNSILEEALMGIKNLKAYVNEKFEISRYSVKANAIKKLAIKTAIWRGLFISFILVIMFGAVVFIIWRGIELVRLGPDAGGITNESFFKFIMMTVMIGASAGSIPDLMSKIQNAFGATESLMEIINTIGENRTSASKLQLTGDIELKDLSFSYPSRPDMTVLSGINLKIKQGEKIGVVGASGGGKSTIASLLLQLYRIDEGKIYFDGKDASSYELSDLRNNMAYVPQEVILFGGSIYENIAYGKPGANEQEIIEASEKANAFEFISSFPDGFNTLVGDRGIQLSGGQRQRIAIARAILKDPSILILDEATSALDSESEKAVGEALKALMKGRTSLVIAHRLSTIRDADKIIVLENGNVVEQGTHEELLAQKGSYNSLHLIQEN